MISTALNDKTNELIVTETRAPKPFRALPRQVGLHIATLDESKTFLVRYQDLIGKYVSAVRCWKCGVPICAMQPALHRPEGAKNQDNAEVTMVTVNGKELVLGAMLPFSHYREGLFAYRTPQGVPALFSYLHCADCHIGSEHGEDLLACLLGQSDYRRDYMKTYAADFNDDAWAQSMFRWSGIALVGTEGMSKGPTELMQGKG